MSSFRVWLFRVLVAIAASLMVTSAIMPWWAADIFPVRLEPFSINIYQYGIPSSQESSQYWSRDVTPFYQTVLAWVYLAVSAGLILFSTWLKGRKGRWFLGGTGLIYIAYAAIAVIWIAIRTGDFGVSLQGWSDILAGDDEAYVNASVQFGYYLAHVSGLMCIALALLRNIIVGRPKPGT